MGNKNRLILSVVLLFVVSFLSLLFIGQFAILFGTLLLFAGVWAILEGIVFVKKKENKKVLPLVLIALYVALSSVFLGFAEILGKIVDSGAEGLPIQGFAFLWFFVSILASVILGTWSVIQGIILLKNKENVKLGVVSLIIGGVLLIFGLISLIGFSI